MSRLARTVALAAVLALAMPATAHAAPGFDPAAPAARAAGSDRYDTAAKAALSAWTGVTGGTVIVANGATNGIDALSASYLAGFRDAPILLTARDTVPAPTAAAIAALAPAHVIVIGAEPSVSAATYAALTTGRDGDRIGGVDRYDTAARVAAFTAPIDPTNGTGYRPYTVFVARGDVPANQIAADALAASPVAFRGHFPILLTTPTSLPESTRFALKLAQPKNVVVLGDYNAADASTVSEIMAAASPKNSITPVQRFGGRDRSATAAIIADSVEARGAGIGSTAVGFANGTTVDALAGGAAAGKGGYPILLAPSRDDVGDGTRAYVAAHQDTLTQAYVFGDERSLTTAALTALRSPASS